MKKAVILFFVLFAFLGLLLARDCRDGKFSAREPISQERIDAVRNLRR